MAIGMRAAIDIMNSAELKSDFYDGPNEIVFDARPDEVFAALRMLAAFAQENYDGQPITWKSGHEHSTLF